MRKRGLLLLHAIASAGLALGGAEQASADNWMRSEGEAYYKASIEYDSTQERWNQDFKRETMSCAPRNWKLNQSYEYGMSYYKTFFGSLDYLQRTCGDFEAHGVGDLSLGVRSRLNIYRNGRTWEAALIIPTGYSTTGMASVGSGHYGLRMGAYGSFGERHKISGEYGSNVELGANIYFWEGSAPEQFSGYLKYNFAATDVSHFYGALEGDYALIDRGEDMTATVNAVSDYGYDRLNARIGYSRRVGLYWRSSLEATNVLWGRNTNDSNSVKLSFSRSFQD